MCVGGRCVYIYQGRERESIYIERVYIMWGETRERVCERIVSVCEREKQDKGEDVCVCVCVCVCV
jgi:hypothetical protein